MNKKHIVQIIAMVLLLSMMFSTVAFAMPTGQEKMPPGQAKKLIKYEEAFNLMKKERIMIGDNFGDYRLNDFVKRGDITVMIVRAFKLNMMDKPIEEMKADDFLDLIDKNNYQYNFVKIAKHYNIAKGDGNNFYPDKFVSYDEAFALIERAVKVANSNVTVLNEKDEEIKLRDWYKEFVKDDEYAFNKSLKKLVNVGNYGDPATRGDIASMLYYVLTGKKDFNFEEESGVIEIKIKENTFLDFDDLNLKDYEGNQVKFELPKEGKLTIDEKELSNKKYDIDIIDKITFTPAVDFTGEVMINYTVYKDNKIVFNGVIKITVTEVTEISKVIEIKNYKKIEFVEELRKVADEEIFDLIDYVKFKLPKETVGKLLIKYNGDGDDEEYVPVIENKKYDLGKIQFLKYEPNNNKDITILFSAYDRIAGQDKKYDGSMNIYLQN